MDLSPSMLAKLDDLDDRYHELSGLLADPETVADRDRFIALSRESIGEALDLHGSQAHTLVLSHGRHHIVEELLEILAADLRGGNFICGCP